MRQPSGRAEYGQKSAHNGPGFWNTVAKPLQRIYSDDVAWAVRVDFGTAVQQICRDLLGGENDYRLSGCI